MDTNYFVKLINYMKNVYHIESGVRKLTDKRVNPTYKTAQVIMPLLLGFMLRIESMNAMKFRLQQNEFDHVFSWGTKLPHIDTFRDTLKVLEIDGLKIILRHTVERAIANKAYDNGTIDGYMVGAIDGTKFFGSNKKSCEECLTNKRKDITHSYHSGVVMAVIGNGPKLTVGFEMYKAKKDSEVKDEGELDAAKRLMSDVSMTYGNIFDVVVYDALACNSVWINHCLSLETDVLVRVKENNINSLKEVKRITNKKEPVEVWEKEKGFESVKVYESTYKMDNVNQDLRFVKFEMKHKDGRHSQILIVTSCIEMSLATLFKMIRARWDIENCIFNNLKEHCGLEHCYVHGGNAVEAIIYLIFIASNIMQLFLCRRLRRNYETQKEIVRLISNGFIKLEYLPDLVFKGS